MLYGNKDLLSNLRCYESLTVTVVSNENSKTVYLEMEDLSSRSTLTASPYVSSMASMNPAQSLIINKISNVDSCRGEESMHCCFTTLLT